ncbi:MAG: M67 family metallopeptidase [Rhodocyclaceae bacterium]|nr:M67 family metallopeptidase [Rhodocyclaceae bacterium]MBX3667010.1 M67 family metallopeptidase [Rhodocyclaceae bacterium]
MDELLLLPAQRAQLETWATAAYPLEACGLMLGRRAGQGAQVEAVRSARNLSLERAHDRFELDPLDFLAIDAEARAAGQEILGVWHTHPDHPAQPSDTDRVAAWQDWCYVILSVTRQGVLDLRSWRLEQDQFVEQTVRGAPIVAA